MINAPAGGAQRCGPGGLVLTRPEVAVVLLAEAEVAPAPALAHAASKQGRTSVMGYIIAQHHCVTTVVDQPEVDVNPVSAGPPNYQ